MANLGASSHRRSRSPDFLSHAVDRGVRSLFTSGDENESPMFRNPDMDDAEELGMESLAPPLPAPITSMTPDMAERLGQAIQRLHQASASVAAEMESTALEIAMLVARKILEAEIKADPGVARQMVKAAVRRLGDTHKVSIRLAPTDAELVRAGAAEGVAAEFGVAKVEIIADINLTPGDCIVDSDAASVDGRLGTRVEELRRVLEAAIHQESSG